MFSITNLKASYPPKTIFEIAEWQAQQGEHWLLLGNSGSGKTTLLHILGGLLRPSSGKVQVARQDIQALSSSALDRFRARNIGLIFQKPHLIETLSVLKNLLLTQYLGGIPSNTRRCEEVLEQLNIHARRNAYPRQLSEGEKQRVSVARAVLNTPALILADEPTASLDDANALQVVELLKSQAAEYKATLLIATHDQRVKKAFSLQYSLNTDATASSASKPN